MWKGELRHWPSMVLNSCCWFGQLKPSLSMTERLAVTLFLLSITDMSQPWRWHNSSQDWYLHCQLPFHSQILKSRLSTLDTCLWGPVRTQWWMLSVFSRMILPGWQHGILHPRSSQTHNLGGLMSWCCSATLLPSAVTHSHGKTSPLIISATLTWIPSDLIFDLSFIYWGTMKDLKKSGPKLAVGSFHEKTTTMCTSGSQHHLVWGSLPRVVIEAVQSCANICV